MLGTELCGASSKQLTIEHRDRGYIFQAHNLHQSLTALQNVKVGLKLHSEYSLQEINDRSIEMLELVWLGSRINYYPDDLSPK